MPPGIRLLISDTPSRAIALSTGSHALVLKTDPVAHQSNRSRHTGYDARNHSDVSQANGGAGGKSPKCIAEFGPASDFELDTWRQLGFREVYGTLGLIAIGGDVFLCVVDSVTKAAEVRPEETVQRIGTVQFHCLTSSRYDHLLNDAINPYPMDDVDEAGYDLGHPNQDGQVEHPCLAIKKLMSTGTFYYSQDFDLTRRLQKRATDLEHTVAIESLDAGFLWNSYMIEPLLDFRTRLSDDEKSVLDDSNVLISAIRGFCTTIAIPYPTAPFQMGRSGQPSNLSIISRLSCRRAGTRFNSRGIDDDGNVANFVESETIFWSPSGYCMSYVQIRGSLPVFWEQTTGLLPHQQKITISRAPDATQPAFDRHFDHLEKSYGAVHIVNLLSAEKQQEIQLSELYRSHVARSPLNEDQKQGAESEHRLLRLTEYDFHAETRGGNYSSAKGIKNQIRGSAEGFVYFLTEERITKSGKLISSPILQQEGVFRTNCLDCLDRTNVIQEFISQMALESFLNQQREQLQPDFWGRHSILWADNGDQLSKIYAGTGALKSSFTRSGKNSLGGFLSDARKSATRAYMNNFADKGRQMTTDMLLGRLVNQIPVRLYDPVHEWVHNELRRRAPEFTSAQNISILVGTFNLNGKDKGIKEDLSPWLCPDVATQQQSPELVVVAFQEIVELSPQQIMSTDPHRRQYWEQAVTATLNDNASRLRQEEYVFLRGSQLVGASLSVFIRRDSLSLIKNVEASIKKTGMSGMAGNKGAVAIRMDYANTSLCFVTAHLAAGFSNYDERNRDYKTITQGLRFQRDRCIDDHESVIWLGDFNYRIGLDNHRTRQLINSGDLETLYKNDQLNLQMMHGNVFSFYEEARITFLPTYKFNNGTDEYDTSEKARVPAWTDRVLKKGGNLIQINYDIANLRFSDHRPVYATFICTVQLVDEQRKEEIRNTLFLRRRKSSGNTQSFEDRKDDSLVDLEASEKGLPPPMSDRRKWFLDNGTPARTIVKPPSDTHTVNGNRPSNPFAPTDEPDWIKVEKDRVPAPPPTRRIANGATRPASQTGDSYEVVSRNSTPPKLPEVRRRMAPPFAQSPLTKGTNCTPSLPGRDSERTLNTNGNTRAVSSLPSSGSQTSLNIVRRVLPPPPLATTNDDPKPLARQVTESTSPIDGKKGPPIRPKKPSSLSSTAISPISRPSSIASSNPPDIPQPRRSQAHSQPHSRPPLPVRRPSLAVSSRPASTVDDKPATPKLPPRKPVADSDGVMVEKQETGNLMDEGRDEDGLKDYMVLRPQKQQI